MSESLRILTYNTQLRSWAMQVGASPGYTIPPIDTAEERAKIIADQICASPFDYDIVGLAEVFDEDARDVLRDGMRARFPYMVTKADYDHVRHESNNPGTENVPLLASWRLVGQPGEIESSYRLEDSGLMLFSRWPFVEVSTSSLDPATKALCAASGMPVPAAIPAINFWPYTDTAGHDGDACKGVLYMRVQRDQWTAPYHVFMSHTQADDDRLEENRSARSKQLDAVGAFMKACAGGLPFPEETFFMGDLNISGEGAATYVDGREWQDTFLQLGRVVSDYAVDTWGRRQCTGAPGLRDPGFSATVRYPPQEQRLDYVVQSMSSGLAAQHVMIDHDLATVPPGHDEVSYLSDHLPLRIDLARPRANSTPADALRLAFPAPPATAYVTDDDYVFDGQVKWYRFDEPGTYDFAVWSDQDSCDYLVYLDTDLSRPRQQYRTEEHPDFGKKFVLASAPFLVKVFAKERHREAEFSFRVHKHLGVGPWDAIQLPYGVTVPEAFPLGGQRLNDDASETDWADEDTKWFRLDSPQVPLDRDLDVMVEVVTTGVESGVSIVRETGPGSFELEAQSFGFENYREPVTLRQGDKVYVQVHRRDGMTPGPLDVTVTATTDLSILLGGKRGRPRLLCQDETSGWGADDIAMKIRVDGKLIADISNDAIGDFDQDDVRDLDQWVPDLVPYFDGVEFKVIEEDDTSPDDIGQETLRPRDELEGWDRFAVTKSDDDRTIRGALWIDVDDGTYVAQVSVTTWDEQF
jgi:endonuclease/exonuclease/phosphatase family metal-dependent hydrolase